MQIPELRLPFVLLLLGLHATPAAAAPRVVASIAPLGEIAAALMHGVAEPTTIVARGASAHHFALRPSHLRRLEQADLVIWIDRRFESGFANLPELLPAATRRLEVLPRLGPDSDDGHIWYSPQRLLATVALLRDALVDIDPEHAVVYRANAAALARAIESWRDGLARDLDGRRVALLTDHAFLGYLAGEFAGLEIEAVHDVHDDHGGLRHLQATERWLREHRPRCLLTQEGKPAALARRLASSYRLDVIDLDAPPAGARPGLPGRLDHLRATLKRCAAA